MRSVWLFAAFLSVAGMASAKTDAYECKMDRAAAESWVPEVVLIHHDTTSGEVTVKDPIIMHFLKAPTTGFVQTDNEKRITFRWTLDMIRNKSGQVAPKFLYSATYFKATGKAQVKAIPAGYDNQFLSQGTCIVK